MVWIFVIIFYTASYTIPFISNAELQANIVLCLVLIPCARAGARYYYKNGDHTSGFLLGVVMVVIAMILDSLITVPVFIIPGGGSHLTFFSDPAFWVIALECPLFPFSHDASCCLPVLPAVPMSPDGTARARR